MRDGAQLRFKTWLMASDAISSQVGGKASDLECARWKRVSQDDSHGLFQFAVSCERKRTQLRVDDALCGSAFALFSKRVNSLVKTAEKSIAARGG